MKACSPAAGFFIQRGRLRLMSMNRIISTTALPAMIIHVIGSSGTFNLSDIGKSHRDMFSDNPHAAKRSFGLSRKCNPSFCVDLGGRMRNRCRCLD